LQDESHQARSVCDVVKGKNRRDDKEDNKDRAWFSWAPRARGRYETEDLIHVQIKKCQQAGCTMHPTFNFGGEQLGTFCGQHKLEGMVRVVKSQRCEHAGCNKHPSCNFEGEQGCRFCLQHRLEGMVYVKCKVCVRWVH